ncbi:hypothetical protein HMPREF1556_00781, partial [Porphyromonas sp. oral taxon 278 str. W7784]|uniref:hypothetical protein n=1 Tax=Porphyromonas sp. oral taxon 278 TaxID=712437 RepID=UPI0003AD2165
SIAITALLFIVKTNTKESHEQHDLSTMSQGFEPNHLAGGGDQQLLVTAPLRFTGCGRHLTLSFPPLLHFRLPLELLC